MMLVRLADGKPRQLPRRSVRLPYKFDGFSGTDEFLVIDMSKQYDCILGMPWLTRHRPEIDWVQRSLRPNKRDINVAAVSDHLRSSSGAWTHVRVVNSSSSSTLLAEVCDGPSCPPRTVASARTRVSCPGVASPKKEGKGRVSSPPPASQAVEQGLPSRDVEVCPPSESVVEQRLPQRDIEVRPLSDSAVEQGLPHGGSVERGLPDSLVAVQGSVPCDAKPSQIDRVPSRNYGIPTSNRFAVLDDDDDDNDDDEVFHPSATADPVQVAVAEQKPKRKQRRGSKRSRDSRSAPQQASTSATAEESITVLAHGATKSALQEVMVASPPSSADEIVKLPGMSWKTFLRDLKAGEIEQICPIVLKNDEDWSINAIDDFDHIGRPPEAEHKSAKEERFQHQSLEALRVSGNPAYELVKEFIDIFPEEVPDQLPIDRGIRHEIDLLPGSKYCVTRQWPLPREQVEAIDEFFEKRRRAGHVRESSSPHSSPTFCVKKATGGWRIVHAYNKLNDATIPAQTPIPRKDMVLDSMAGSTVFSGLDMKDGFYQILMRKKDIPLTAVSTPSGMLWEWLVMPQGLKNAPATFNRMVSHVLRPLRAFASSYFDDVFVHSKAADGKSAMEAHLLHLRQVFEALRENSLYANLKKCVFCADEIPILGCYVGRNGVRADPEKVESIRQWPTPRNPKDLRQWLGLANYLHKYTRNYAEYVRPLTQLLKKDADWEWRPEHQEAFERVKKTLSEAPILALPDSNKPFHVVCDASNFAIGCALMQFDDNGRERVVSYQSRQLKPAEQNYPVHDKELLAMRYALIKFRVYLLGEQSFAVYTDHASLRTAVKSPHLSQRMARWLSFFADYNFVVHYKPGKTNILADALSRRPDYDARGNQQNVDTDDEDCACCTVDDLAAMAVAPVTDLWSDLASATRSDPHYGPLFAYLETPSDAALKRVPSSLRASRSRYSVQGNVLVYRVDAMDEPRVVVPNDESLRSRIIHEFHDAPVGGHFGREKTYAAISREFFWPHQYRWVRKWVRTCETCQRVKAAPAVRAPLRPLPVPKDAWSSISMDFVFGLPPDKLQRTGIVVFVDRLSKMVHMAPVHATVTAEETAAIFLDVVFRHHGLPDSIVSDRDVRFTSAFWTRIFQLLGSRLSMSTAQHPETDGQTERVNRVLEDILRSYATSYSSWSDFLPIVEFAINNATHASTGLSPFFVVTARHPRVPALLGSAVRRSSFGGGEVSGDVSDPSPRAAVPTPPNSDENVAPVQTRSQAARAARPPTSITPIARWAARELIREPVARPSAGAADDERPDENRSPDPSRPRLQNGMYSSREGEASSAPITDTGFGTHTGYGTGSDLGTVPQGNFSRNEEMRQAASEKAAEFVLRRQAVIRFVRDAIAESVDRQKEQADRHGRRNTASFAVGDRVLLSTDGIAPESVTNLGSRKLGPRYIGPFKILYRRGDAYTLDIPRAMKLHPTFNVSRLKKYYGSIDMQDMDTQTTSSGDASATNGARSDEPHEDLDSTPAGPARLEGAADPAPARPVVPEGVGREDLHGAPLQAAPTRSLVSDPSNTQAGSEETTSGTRRTIRTQTDASLRAPTSMSSDGPSRAAFQRDGPPPLVDSAGNVRWIVDRIVDHDDPLRARGGTSRPSKIPAGRRYRVRWLGFPPSADTWEPRAHLLADVPDTVADYEGALSERAQTH